MVNCWHCDDKGCKWCKPIEVNLKPGFVFVPSEAQVMPNIAPQVLAGAKHVHTFAEGEEHREMLVHNNVLFVATNKMVYCLNEAGKLEPLSLTPKPAKSFRAYAEDRLHLETATVWQLAQAFIDWADGK